MLETVTKGFKAAKNRLAGKVELTPELVDESLRDIRVSLLEADVSFDVVKKFVARVREKSVGETVQTVVTDKDGKKHKVSGGEYFVKVCHDELEPPPPESWPTTSSSRATSRFWWRRTSTVRQPWTSSRCWASGWKFPSSSKPTSRPLSLRKRATRPRATKSGTWC
jgi:hypothetical protein